MVPSEEMIQIPREIRARSAHTACGVICDEHMKTDGRKDENAAGGRVPERQHRRICGRRSFERAFERRAEWLAAHIVSLKYRLSRTSGDLALTGSSPCAVVLALPAFQKFASSQRLRDATDRVVIHPCCLPCVIYLRLFPNKN